MDKALLVRQVRSAFMLSMYDEVGPIGQLNMDAVSRAFQRMGVE